MSDWPKMRKVYGEAAAPGVRISVEEYPHDLGLSRAVRLCFDALLTRPHLDLFRQDAQDLRDALTRFLEANP